MARVTQGSLAIFCKSNVFVIDGGASNPDFIQWGACKKLLSLAVTKPGFKLAIDLVMIARRGVLGESHWSGAPRTSVEGK